MSSYISLKGAFGEGPKGCCEYVVALNISVAAVSRLFSHDGSSHLDEINAFDVAEISVMDMGKLNLIKVSSFCGPDGLFWGIDLAKAKGLRQITSVVDHLGNKVSVLDADPLIDAAKRLFGTVDAPRFPIAPGTLCPATYGNRTFKGPGIVYGAAGIGICGMPYGRLCLLMEDQGRFDLSKYDAIARCDLVIGSMVASVLEVAKNQRVTCEKVFVGYRETMIAEDEVGCALTAMPYFSLAKNAIPPGGINVLKKMDIDGWEQAIELSR